jgi:hypothetical protein
MQVYTETVTRRVGENIGEIPADYPFHESSSYPCNPETRIEKGQKILEIQKLFREGKKISVFYDPIIGGDLLDIGMYDGWPYWKPTPAMLLSNWRGVGEWHFWTDIHYFEVKPASS